MLTYDNICEPAHYVAGRSIQPIKVIEGWQLCHHLACLVKYIARLERKENTYRDLQKAEWYLKRELDHTQKGFNRCQLRLVEPRVYLPQEIAKDWQLSANLGSVLHHVQQAKKIGMRQEALNQALHYLQREIRNYEEK